MLKTDAHMLDFAVNRLTKHEIKKKKYGITQLMQHNVENIRLAILGWMSSFFM